MPPNIDESIETSSDTRRLFLIGYRGCGKTSVGQAIAAKLAWTLVDTDDVVARRYGDTIAKLFATQGEACFRELETEAIASLCQQDGPAIISLGGGAPTVERNREMIVLAGKTVWLRATPETLWSRIHQDEKSADQRPNLTQAGGLQEVKNVLEWRTPIYSGMADLTVDVDQSTIQNVADDIIHRLNGWHHKPID